MGVYPHHVRLHHAARAGRSDRHHETARSDTSPSAKGSSKSPLTHVAIVTDMAIPSDRIDEAKVEEARARPPPGCRKRFPTKRSRRSTRRSRARSRSCRSNGVAERSRGRTRTGGDHDTARRDARHRRGLAALLSAPIRAQYGTPQAGGLQLPFENGRIRVTQISVPAGGALPAAGNRVLIYLTADADGRMPADAVWQNADAGSIQNRGPATLEAIAIEFKDAPGAQTDGTPPEALDAQYGVDVSTVIDNPRVLVTRQRYRPIAYGAPLHLHPEDVVVVYLGGGYTWPGADLWGASRVSARRRRDSRPFAPSHQQRRQRSPRAPHDRSQ